MNRRHLLLAAALPFQVTEGEHLHLAGRGLGWTILRDRAPSRAAPETGMVLIRAQRPVPPASRPGHLAATLHAFRPFRFAGIPAEESIHLAGLPGAAIEARATGIGSRQALTVRAVCLYGRERSYLLIASAPEAEWAALRPEVLRLMEAFRPG